MYRLTLNALIAYGVTGETAAVTTNSLGAHFHITDEKTPEGKYRAFVITPQLAILEGTWTWTDTAVVIAWSNGMTAEYPYDCWKPNCPILNRVRDEQKRGST